MSNQNKLFMQPEDSNVRLLKYLNNALAAAQEIEISTTGLSERNFYFNNIKWLVERGIEIISEALKRATAIDYSLNDKITDLHKIYGTRIKIAHHYDIVDPLPLYNIVIKNIPVLIGEPTTLIENIENKK